MIEVDTVMCPTLIASVTEVCTKFTKTLSLLSQCHCIHELHHRSTVQGTRYSMTQITTRLILPTETAIPQFMENFRASFPDSSIPPKMHLLEDLIVPWAKEWHVEFGLLGEQGADHVQQLPSVIKDHCPT